MSEASEKGTLLVQLIAGVGSVLLIAAGVFSSYMMSTVLFLFPPGGIKAGGVFGVVLVTWLLILVGWICRRSRNLMILGVTWLLCGVFYWGLMTLPVLTRSTFEGGIREALIVGRNEVPLYYLSGLMAVVAGMALMAGKALRIFRQSRRKAGQDA